jgi:hypothetical protein
LQKNKKASKKLDKSVSYPRHSIQKILRIPEAILAQNAGKDCTEKEAAKFVGVGYGGTFRLEISSCIKYGFLRRPSAGKIAISELARRALRPQTDGDDIKAFQEAVRKAPQISAVYEHYRGENLPDRKFFENALVDNFKVPDDKVKDFINIFEQSLEKAQLMQKIDDHTRIIDATEIIPSQQENEHLREIKKDIKIASDDSCFVIMPFAGSIGTYYEKIYAPAIKKVSLNPVRADTEIFGTGKIMDQIWSGINAARVLVAELIGRNPNVFYELGLAHALQKPVVLVSGTEADVPFDLKHIRVIYYDMADPFWGQKLQDKVSENILSALKNPDEAILPRMLERK